LPPTLQLTDCDEHADPDAQVVLDVETTPFVQVATAAPVVAPPRSSTVTDVPLSPPG
jgi:hypothetical protein